ncbi:hypothetical protein DPMN_060530 [Dreissena polymorpha]|uniref:Uncharacterized protein n=1 Tax=Dreissena polymorpha TaxID=45954 RepID=A0A9D4C627_DREPO|nr:hypothetical protein DPMN_060530 [Dreissena polymorpha]
MCCHGNPSPTRGPVPLLIPQSVRFVIRPAAQRPLVDLGRDWRLASGDQAVPTAETAMPTLRLWYQGLPCQQL